MGMVKFSLAGVQLKLTGDLRGDRLTLPGQGESGRFIIKLPAKPYPGLPEAEFAAMQLAQVVGVDTAHCQLVSRDIVRGVPAEFLAHGDNVLVVDRFDRPATPAFTSKMPDKCSERSTFLNTPWGRPTPS
jgi:serine/threonine-protein kinase HipA